MPATAVGGGGGAGGGWGKLRREMNDIVPKAAATAEVVSGTNCCPCNLCVYLCVFECMCVCMVCV